MRALLAEALDVPEARTTRLDRTFASAELGPRLAPALREWLDGLGSAELARWLIGGVAYDELPFRVDSLETLARRGDFVLAPLPNQLFTRDTSAWVYGGVCINNMARDARVRESVHLDAIYTYHPRFAALPFAPGRKAGSTTRRSKAATSSSSATAACSSAWESGRGRPASSGSPPASSSAAPLGP